jgi:hypothetical protein
LIALKGRVGDFGAQFNLTQGPCPAPQHYHGPEQEGVDQAYRRWWCADQHP